MSSRTRVAVGIVLSSLFALLLITAVWLVSKAGGGAFWGAAAAAVGGLVTLLLAKSFEFRKQHHVALAEKRREVYRRLLAPWESVLAHISAGKPTDDLVKAIDLPALYSSAFDAALYGSETVLKQYGEFRSIDPTVDGVDRLRSLARLLIAMREDVTGAKCSLSEEAVLRTFVNFKDEELVLLRLREYVDRTPQTQQRLRELLRQSGQASGTDPAGRPPQSAG